MTFSRSLLFGRPTNIMVPWMNPVGLARNLSRLASSHVMLRVFHCRREIEPGHRAAFAADNAGKRRPGLIVAGLYRVAHGAMACEDGLAGARIASRPPGRGAEKDDQQPGRGDF